MQWINVRVLKKHVVFKAGVLSLALLQFKTSVIYNSNQALLHTPISTRNSYSCMDLLTFSSKWCVCLILTLSFSVSWMWVTDRATHCDFSNSDLLASGCSPNHNLKARGRRYWKWMDGWILQLRNIYHTHSPHWRAGRCCCAGLCACAELQVCCRTQCVVCGVVCFPPGVEEETICHSTAHPGNTILSRHWRRALVSSRSPSPSQANTPDP